VKTLYDVRHMTSLLSGVFERYSFDTGSTSKTVMYTMVVQIAQRFMIS